MEKALGLNLGQAEWWIKGLVKKGEIKITRKCKLSLGLRIANNTEI